MDYASNVATGFVRYIAPIVPEDGWRAVFSPRPYGEFRWYPIVVPVPIAEIVPPQQVHATVKET